MNVENKVEQIVIKKPSDVVITLSLTEATYLKKILGNIAVEKEGNVLRPFQEKLYHSIKNVDDELYNSLRISKTMYL